MAETHAQLAAGTAVGRYVIESLLGESGRGAVYQAFDTELGRAIALKMMNDAPADRERLMGEVQALARLSHPNVLPVYDVGTFEGHVFIATEFVAGATLRDWLRAAPRPRAEVLAVLRAAGEGLAAAHRAGLIHRDFKPDNVMVGNDGRVRVLDFGQLRSSDGYMAPEQLAGGTVDARADQFAFAIVLYEALYGQSPVGSWELGVGSHRHPTPGSGLKLPTPNSQLQTTSGPVPRALWALVARALSLAPDARFPSMDALLLQLDRAAAPPPRSRRGPILLLAGVAIAGLVAGVALRRQATAACRGPERALAAAWSPARKRDLRAAFLATRMPYAGAAFARIEASLDRYARDWTALHASTCEAAPERDSASQELFDLRLACLGDRLAGFAAQVEVLAAADSKTVELADRAARTLPTLADCADEAGLRAPVRPPADPAVRARVVEVRKQLGRARALEAAGRYPEGLAVASAAAAAAPVLGYRPLEGEALLTLGSLQSANGESKEAAATLRAAALAAEAGHADDVRAAALITLVEVTGEQLGHYDEAHAFGRQADVVLQRIDHGGQRAPLLATLARNEGIVWWRQGRYDRAIAALDQALALRTREFGPDDGRVAQTLSDIADTRSDQGQLEAALADYRRVLAIWSPTLGPEHPQVAVVLNNMANVLANQGKLDDALAQFQHALAIWTRALGPQHPKVGAVLNNIGDTYSRLRRYDEALDCYGRALPIFEAAYGPAHYTVGIAYVSRGETEQALGRLEAALVSYRRGLGILGKALGPTHPQLSIPLADIGDTLRLRGDLDGAMASYRRAQALFDKSPQSPELARVLVGVGLVLLAKHQPDAALAPLTRSVALLEAHPGDPVALADARFALARALWLQGRDRTAADAMAAATRDVYRQAGPRGQDQLNAVEKWLEDRR